MSIQVEEQVERSKLDDEEHLRYVGKSIPKIDAVEKVTGKAVYAVDMSLPFMLFGKLKRSNISHAQILGVDTSRAAGVQGVRAILTGADIPDTLFGAGISDTPLLAKDRVRYFGEPVAAVAADTLEAAEEAVGLIEVKYQELPPIYDPEAAMKPNASVLLHPNLMTYKTTSTWPPVRDPSMLNVCNYVKVRKGNVEKAFSEAHLIVENRFSTNLVQHVHTEPNATVARVENDGGITVWTATQSVYRTRHMLCEALKLQPSKVRVISTEVGGGFGNKLFTVTAEALGVLLSKKSGKPVKIQLTREEVFTATTTRHPFIIYVKDGVQKDGKIIARQIRAILDGGAYSAGSGVAVGRNTVFSAVTTYNISNIQIDTYRVYTNKVPSGAFRGFGTTQMVWATECQMDIISEKLAIDPVRLRQINVLKEGELSGLGEFPSGINHTECLLEASKSIDLSTKSNLPSPWKVGKGLALSEKYSGEPGSCASIRYRSDGFVEARVSVQETGQGTRTGMAQIVAEELELPIQRIKIIQADTDATPYDSGALSSRQTFNIGNAVILACRDLKKNMFEAASKRLGSRAEELWMRDDVIFAPDGKSIPVQDLFIRNKSRYGAFLEKSDDFNGFGTWLIDTGEIDPATGQATIPKLCTGYTSGAWGVELAVNAETGQVKILRAICVADVGKAINPKLAEGQIEGSVSMGISTAMYEELVVENGQIINPDFKDYKLLNMQNAVPIEVKFVEKPSIDGPFGAKPIGEVGIIGIAPAIAGAIRDATGVRIFDLPLTAEKILKAIKSRS